MFLSLGELITSTKAILTAYGITAGALLLLFIKLVLTSIQNAKQNKKVEKLLEDHGITLNEQCQNEIENIENKLDAKMNDIYNAIAKKLRLDSEEKAKQVEENASKLKELLNQDVEISLDEEETAEE